MKKQNMAPDKAKELLSIRDELRRLDGMEESIQATLVSQRLAREIVRAERCAAIARYRRLERELRALGIELSETEPSPRAPDARGILSS